MKIETRPFGATPDGSAVHLYTVTNEHGVAVAITDYGGVIATLKTPDSAGNLGDIVLGFDSLQDYLSRSPFFGCIVGRYANRIAGGRFTLNDVEYRLAQNDGQNHLHGGMVGFDKVVWDVESFDRGDAAGLKLSYISADGEEGYPGNLAATVTYTLTNENELRVDYAAATDAPTVLNLTNHTYFNLAGSGHILDHVVTIYAESFTPVDGTLIPTGELRPVDGSPLDFRQPATIGARIDQDDEQLRLGGGYDHNYVIDGRPGELRPAALVTEPTSGRTLEVHTTQPGMQFYSGNMMPDALPGKGGQVYSKRSGFCLETQHFPDSPNQPNFPSTLLSPSDEYRETTVFKFGVVATA